MSSKTKQKPELGFDAKQRAADRESADVVIGDSTFHRRRRNWELTRAVRRILNKRARVQRDVEQLAARSLRLDRELSGLPADGWEGDEPPTPAEVSPERYAELRAEWERVDEEMDGRIDERDELTYEQLSAMLADDDGESPDVGMLKQELDAADIAPLLNRLGDEDEPDPTTATGTSSAS